MSLLCRDSRTPSSVVARSQSTVVNLQKDECAPAVKAWQAGDTSNAPRCFDLDDLLDGKRLASRRDAILLPDLTGDDGHILGGALGLAPWLATAFLSEADVRPAEWRPADTGIFSQARVGKMPRLWNELVLVGRVARKGLTALGLKGDAWRCRDDHTP